MAAWVARIDSVSDAGTTAGTVQVTCSYFLATDTLFTNRLGAAGFPVDASTPLPQIRAQIVAYGQNIRAAQNAAAAAQGQVGTTIAVP